MYSAELMVYYVAFIALAWTVPSPYPQSSVEAKTVVLPRQIPFTRSISGNT